MWMLVRRGKFGQRHRQTRRTPCGDTQTQKEDGHRKTEVEIRLCCHKPKKAWGFPELEEARKDPPLETSEGVWP